MCGATDRDAGLSTPILMRVIGGAFTAIAKEMAGVLYRMSYSSIIRESEDLGAGIFDGTATTCRVGLDADAHGRDAEDREGVSSLLGDDIHDGDVILHNDPYLGASHSPDVAIVIPIFCDGELVGVRRRSAHLLDIGGAFPGLAVDLVDNWSRGTSTGLMKLCDRGVRQEQMWRHILENIRTPTHNQGDIQAMIAACELARRASLAARPLRHGGD